MSEVSITEVLPEGDDRLWVSLDDGLTRLLCLQPLLTQSSHHALHLHRLARRPAVTSDGRFVRWPGGAYLDAESVRQAPAGHLPVDLIGLMPFAQRFRPLHSMLVHADPNLHGYPDVRPEVIVQKLLGLKTGELEPVYAHHPAPAGLVLARLSDLALLLSAWFPDGAASLLLRRPWPHAMRRFPHDPLFGTALGCLRYGRIDLIEAPLALLASGAPAPVTL